MMVRTFVRAFLAIGTDTFRNAAASYRAVYPNANLNTSRQEGWRLMDDEDTKEEMERQLRAIDKAADLDDQWVYDRWRAIANANIFDYMDIDANGVADFSKLDPRRLTPEQQLCIEEVQLDKQGRVVKFKLASKNQAVANVARARQMIDGKRDLAAVDLAKTITERMNRAAARVGRVFDNDTGREA
jgi:hypothetical protein